MTHPEEQAAYEARIEFELDGKNYVAINRHEWVTIATTDGQTLIETSRFASVDKLTAKAIVYGYLVGLEVGVERGRVVSYCAAEIRKALEVSNG